MAQADSMTHQGAWNRSVTVSGDLGHNECYDNDVARVCAATKQILNSFYLFVVNTLRRKSSRDFEPWQILTMTASVAALTRKDGPGP